MKIILIIVAIIIYASSIAQTKDSIVTTYYPSGKVKENGEFIYYAADGNIDSSITFKKGKLNGLKKISYSTDDIFYFEYHDNTLVDQKIYDSGGSLEYHLPLKKKIFLKQNINLKVAETIMIITN